jgi:bacterioferritin-associated ferredoxin
MLVCHCRCVFEREVRAVVRSGAQTLEEVSVTCGAGAGCGGCQHLIEEIIEAERPVCMPVARVQRVNEEPSRAVGSLPVLLPVVRVAS